MAANRSKDTGRSASDAPASSPCAACGSSHTKEFYRLDGVPANSVVLMPDAYRAIHCPKGDLRLVECAACGLVANSAFDPRRAAYTAEAESTQFFSPTFSSFASRLAEDLVRRYHLRQRRVLEIGCGDGEFLAALCQAGTNSGIGYDPVLHPDRVHRPARGSARYIREEFNQDSGPIETDFVCCKMTLEHIAAPTHFLHSIRAALAAATAPTLFFQVPNWERIRSEGAFWDVYYDHCSYFTSKSLSRLFRRTGFEVLEAWTGYGDQYLMLSARPATGADAPASNRGDFQAAEFARLAQVQVSAWRKRLNAWRQSGRRVVLWGSGSKAVAFVSTLGIDSGSLDRVVDINPHKRGTYLPGGGQAIVTPADLKASPPETVVAMNPVYRDEIRATLKASGIDADVPALGPPSEDLR